MKSFVAGVGVTTTEGVVLKGGSIGKVENLCPRLSLLGIHLQQAVKPPCCRQRRKPTLGGRAGVPLFISNVHNFTC